MLPLILSNLINNRDRVSGSPYCLISPSHVNAKMDVTPRLWKNNNWVNPWFVFLQPLPCLLVNDVSACSRIYDMFSLQPPTVTSIFSSFLPLTMKAYTGSSSSLWQPTMSAAPPLGFLWPLVCFCFSSPFCFVLHCS